MRSCDAVTPIRALARVRQSVVCSLVRAPGSGKPMHGGGGSTIRSLDAEIRKWCPLGAVTSFRYGVVYTFSGTMFTKSDAQWRSHWGESSGDCYFQVYKCVLYSTVLPIETLWTCLPIGGWKEPCEHVFSPPCRFHDAPPLQRVDAVFAHDGDERAEHPGNVTSHAEFWLSIGWGETHTRWNHVFPLFFRGTPL